ncbi:hypothetical protein TPAR_02334 [Tolypocladium paradoxum]|uniref:Uncharacterized protein n=1 Tax=Tolypocladium paradoxum TaxID=94208 RepID=A0A2S4L4X3_9HYPO|nr:hypothetical protein TPAR_02334 [Tolypocladium paradoxum]
MGGCVWKMETGGVPLQTPMGRRGVAQCCGSVVAGQYCTLDQGNPVDQCLFPLWLYVQLQGRGVCCGLQ